MNLVAEPLPDDTASLQNLLLDLLRERERHTTILEKQAQHIGLLEEQLRLLRHKQFGASSEKSADQAELFNEAEQAAADEAVVEAAEVVQPVTATTDAEPKARPGRKPLPVELPRIRIEHDLPDADKACVCGCQRTLIGEETSEQLDIIPAQLRVLVHVRKKYACRRCEAGVALAPLPPQPIPKSNASPGLLAFVTVSKYQDGLPLHRQEAIFRRLAIDLPRNTLAGWMLRTGELVQPLLNLLQERLLAGAIIQCDETPVQVLKEPDKSPESRSYMWVRVGGPPTRKIVLYDYDASRSGDVAKRLLDGYRGYLQTDDYAGYHAVGTHSGVTHLGCWAHARRKFVEAQKVTSTKGAKPKAGKADMALSYIGKLYGIEQRIKDADRNTRLVTRQQESLPLLQQFRQWLDKALHGALPKSALGKALGYLDKNWGKLTLYTEDGRLAIDNNAAENAIRPFVIGRKNWLFSDTPKGAHASAALYSLIETAKANGLEPSTYLRRVFEKLPQARSVEDVEALLPWV